MLAASKTVLFFYALQKSYRYGKGKGLLVKKWLFEQKRTVVLFELIEMLLIPFAQFTLGLLTLKFARCAAAVGAWLGRVDGLLLKGLPRP